MTLPFPSSQIKINFSHYLLDIKLDLGGITMELLSTVPRYRKGTEDRD